MRSLLGYDRLDTVAYLQPGVAVLQLFPAGDAAGGQRDAPGGRWVFLAAETAL
ncbi:MAG: hypothetical protein QXH03_08515 [Candidatus Bathyarchaeia archaeon]